ncbi:MAG: hypothetical protein ABIP95_13100 [Pelobium sp.]
MIAKEITTNGRPEIDFGDMPQPLNEFQKVLRQVLKQQDQLLFMVADYYLNKKHKGFSTKDSALKNELLLQSLKKDIPFKKLLIGIVIGVFAKEEILIYLNNEQEINKRLVEFMFKRISGSII